jgi:GrpB-like predicted nucleotidyltransferase (UPF0157 family)
MALRKVEVVPYHPEWPAMFRAEVELLQSIFGDEVIVIHHVGSTSVPGLSATFGDHQSHAGGARHRGD